MGASESWSPDPSMANVWGRGREHAALPAWVPGFPSAVALLGKGHESKGSILSRTGFLIR